ncbi:hypothetical protein Salat_0575600 [Sesamum alatum]|uniref:Uncharacterized protein n=1 Tax=Sesamum alatum TaxID=300844 RepID=A0AAE1YPD8_9LAMI|nr:hypothetical protein Salat_0575600 [Sesamum alatum]
MGSVVDWAKGWAWLFGLLFRVQGRFPPSWGSGFRGPLTSAFQFISLVGGGLGFGREVNNFSVGLELADGGGRWEVFGLRWESLFMATGGRVVVAFILVEFVVVDEGVRDGAIFCFDPGVFSQRTFAMIGKWVVGDRLSSGGSSSSEKSRRDVLQWVIVPPY